MGDKGGSADQSGMMQAMASAQAAQQAYALGEQQLDWTKQVWNQEQPLMDASEQSQMDLSAAEKASLQQSMAESAAQYAEYVNTYQPIERSYAAEASGWDSPQAIAQARGEAMGSVAEQGQAGLNTAAETLRGYGINPASGRYAGLYTSAQPMLGAAEAAAGTTAAQNLRLQKMGLEAGAINTGRGMVNDTSQLSQTGTGAANSAQNSASGAANTANSNLSTGSTAFSNVANMFNAGSNAMNSYVGAVNGYNDSNAKYAEAGASEMGGLGSALGSAMTLAAIFKAKGGAVGRPGAATGYADGGMVAPTLTPAPYTGMGGGATGIPSAPVMPPQAPPPQMALGATTGGTVPVHASPSMGAATDDVPAMLTANEFVIPKDVATWLGHKHLAGQIDKARQEQHAFANRDDIGGEPTAAIPQHPTFVSRPAHGHAMGGAIPRFA